MISRQKSNKTKGGGFTIQQAPKRKTTNTGSNWNRSAYAQNYSKMTPPRRQHSQASYQMSSQNYKSGNSNSNNNFFRSTSNQNSNQNYARKPVQPLPMNVPPSPQPQIQPQMARHILGMIESAMQQQNKSRNFAAEPQKKTPSPPPVTIATPKPAAQPKITSSLSQRLQRPQEANNNQPTQKNLNIRPADYVEPVMTKKAEKPVPKTLQERLQIKQEVSAPIPVVPVVPEIPKTFTWTTEDPIVQLSNYCVFYKYEVPQYKFFTLPEKRFTCRVTVNKIVHGDYPTDYATDIEAQRGAAAAAVRSIQLEECNEADLEVIEEDEIVPKLFEMIKSVPNGIFRKKIPEMFQETFNRSLPESWFKAIAQNHKFNVEETIKNNEIVFINTEDEQSPTFNERDVAVSKLVLPWEEKHWNLYITNPVSTRQIWARLVGPEYSDKFDELITDIEMCTFDQSTRADRFEINSHYLAFYLDAWHRVRIEEIDTENNAVWCFFIDHGDSEWVPSVQIYICNPEFLTLPGQAICFALDGLEDLDGNPNAKRHLIEELGTKIVIGEILTNRNEFESQEFDGNIRAVLYDTSSNEDINLNPLILKKICDDIPIPTLDRKAVNYVTITYVDDEANMYCQVQNNAMQYLQSLIQNLVQSNTLEKKHQGPYDKKDASELYLIYDVQDRKYYRARFDSVVSESTYKMFCVDFGFKKIVNFANMYRLDSLSVALLSYPDQAVKTKQYNLPEVNDYILGRLRGMLKPGATAMLRVITFAKNLPEVHTFLRSEIDKIPFCVTDVINLENELSETREQDLSEYRGRGPASNPSSVSSVANSSQNDYANPGSDREELIDRINTFHLKPSQAIPKFELPTPNVIFNVIVTVASSPSYFIVQPYDDFAKLNALMRNLQKLAQTSALLRADQLKEGEYYAGWCEDDKTWYRVQVDNIIADQCISVRAVDYGRVFVLNGTTEFKALPSNLRELSQQAIKAKLYGVKPINRDWTADDAVYFGELTSTKGFAAFVKNVQKDEINQRDQVVVLQLVDVSTEKDVYIDQILVNEGRAVHCN